MTTTWTIAQLDRKTTDGFVTTAHWTAVAVDGSFSADTYSTCSWSDGEPTIPYDQLTQAQVLEWVWANGVDKAAIEASIAAQIQDQINPPVIQPPLPWAQQGV